MNDPSTMMTNEDATTRVHHILIRLRKLGGEKKAALARAPADGRNAVEDAYDTELFELEEELIQLSELSMKKHSKILARAGKKLPAKVEAKIKSNAANERQLLSDFANLQNEVKVERRQRVRLAETEKENKMAPTAARKMAPAAARKMAPPAGRKIGIPDHSKNRASAIPGLSKRKTGISVYSNRTMASLANEQSVKERREGRLMQQQAKDKGGDNSNVLSTKIPVQETSLNANCRQASAQVCH